MFHPRQSRCIVRHGMDDISIRREVSLFSRFFLHAEDAEEEVDDDCDEFEDIDVNVVCS